MLPLRRQLRHGAARAGVLNRRTGNPSPLTKSLIAAPRVVAVGADDHPISATAGGPITPGRSYELEITAESGQYLSTAWMFGQSNDLFYGSDRPIPLFAGGKPVSGNMTAQLALWDAGAEVNDEPGLGPNQGLRQATPDAGVAEKQTVAHPTRRR